MRRNERAETAASTATRSTRCSGQTLAISYNIKYVNNYAGQTIAALGCTAVSPLTGASTVQAARDRANYLIQNAQKNNGTATVTQSEIGAMNTLLGCLNAEA